jgi:hypothetical protein
MGVRGLLPDKLFFGEAQKRNSLLFLICSPACRSPTISPEQGRRGQWQTWCRGWPDLSG